MARGNFRWWLEDRHPQYVVAYDPPAYFEKGALDLPGFHRSYRLIHRFHWPYWPPMVVYARIAPAPPPGLPDERK